MEDSRDWIRIHNLSLSIPLGSMLWNKPGDEKKRQPVLVSVAVPQSVRLVGASDDLNMPQAVNYGTLSKVIENASQPGFPCMENMADALATAAFKEFPGINEILITIERPKAVLGARSACFSATRHRDRTPESDKVSIKDFESDIVIGIHPWERQRRQKVIVNLYMSIPCYTQNHKAFDFHSFTTRMSEVRYTRCTVSPVLSEEFK